MSSSFSIFIQRIFCFLIFFLIFFDFWRISFLNYRLKSNHFTQKHVTIPTPKFKGLSTLINPLYRKDDNRHPSTRQNCTIMHRNFINLFDCRQISKFILIFAFLHYKRAKFASLDWLIAHLFPNQSDSLRISTTTVPLNLKNKSYRFENPTQKHTPNLVLLFTEIQQWQIGEEYRRGSIRAVYRYVSGVGCCFSREKSPWEGGGKADNNGRKLSLLCSPWVVYIGRSKNFYPGIPIPAANNRTVCQKGATALCTSEHMQPG